MRDLYVPDSVTALESVARLLDVAAKDTGQSRRAANFLLAWHNAEENGGWDPTDLWQVDEELARDMLIVLAFIRKEHIYPDGLGFEQEITRVWKRWRGNRLAASDSSPS